MPTFAVTTSNWNSAAFWSGINVSSTGQTLDLSGLTSSYQVNVDASLGVIQITDGSTTFAVRDSASAAPADATMGGSSLLSHFTDIRSPGGGDTIDGTSGADYIYAGQGDDYVSAGDGADEIYTEVGNDTIFAGDGNDSVYGWYISSNLEVHGGEGDDVIFGSTGTDTLYGDAGNDTIYSEGDSSVFGGSGNDSIFGWEGSETISGGTGNDSMSGDDNADQFILEDSFGNDTILGGEGAGAGTDFDIIDLRAVTTSVTVDWTTAEAGTIVSGGDTVSFSEIEQIIFTDLADTINATAETVGLNIDAAAGNDRILDGTGNDTIIGGAGNDRATLQGGGGDDSLTDVEVVYVQGDAGNDTLTMTSGDGYVGLDENYNLSFTNATTAISTDGTYTLTTENYYSFDAYGLSNVFDATNAGQDIRYFAWGGDHTVTGSGFADVIIDYGATGSMVLSAGSGDDYVESGGGDDDLDGGLGDDFLLAGDGDDTLRAGYGSDTFDGGADTDTYIVDGTGVDIFAFDINLSTQSDQYGNVYRDIENVIGGTQADTIVGDAENNVLEGRGGADSLSGGIGTDSLLGGDDRDTLLGGTGNDTLDGGTGRDDLDGGAGDDSIYAGADSDVDDIFLSEGNDTVVGSTGGLGQWTQGDYLNAQNITEGLTYTFTGAYGGTVQWGGNTTTFSNITAVMDYGATATDDSYDATAVTAGYLGTWGVTIYDGAGGNDTIVGSDFIDYVELNTNYSALGTADVATGAGDDFVNAYYMDSVTIDGGSGNDSIDAETATSGTIDGGTGNDTINAWGGDHTIRGGLGDDSLRAWDGDDTFIVEDSFGDDTIQGGEGAGTDRDEVDLDAVTSAITLDITGSEAGTITDGSDTIGFTEVEEFTLTDQNDFVDLNYVDDYRSLTFHGGTGNDTIDFEGLDWDGDGLTATITDAGYTVSDGTDIITGTGFEAFEFGYSGDFIDASATTTGVSLFNRSASWDGSDADTVLGGSGDDTLRIGDGDVIANAGAGNDVITSINGDKTILFEDGFGDDTIDSSTGRDRLDFSGLSAQAVVVSMTSGTDGLINSGADSALLDSFSSAAFDDFILSQNNDSFTASGSDAFFVDGGAGADTLTGGAGADTLIGGDGDDSISGGAGADFLKTGQGQDTLDGGDGNDTLMNSAGDDSLVGGAGDDLIVATQGQDTLEGGAGADTLMGGTDGDSLDGGADNDLLLGDLAGVTFNETGTDGVGLASGVTGFPTTQITYELTFSSTDTSGDTSLGSYAVSGEDNEFSLQLQSGSLAIYVGGAFTNTGIPAGTFLDGNVNTLAVSWDSGTGALEVYLNGISAYSGTTATGTTLQQGGTFALAQDQDIVGGGFDTPQAFEGTIYGVRLYDDVRSASEILDSTHGPVADTSDANLIANWVADADSASFTDQTGNYPMSTSGDVAANWSDGDDTLRGGSGDDTIYGGGGADTFVVEDGFGNDSIVGGEGGTDSDTVDLSAMTGPVTVTYTGDEAGTITDGTDTITFSEIERIITTDQADRVDGRGSPTEGINVETRDGDDTVIGSDNADSIAAGAGNDFVEAEDGDDTIDGGLGDDTIFFGDGSNSVTGGDGNDIIDDAPGNPGYSGQNTIDGGDGNDTVYAGYGDDTVLGGAGDDDLNAQWGNDSVDGGTGNDNITNEFGDATLRGGQGNDTISGGFNDDTIEGGTGNDSLTGGDADDTFIFNVGDGADTITDFNAGNTGALGDGDTTNNDFIDLSSYYTNLTELRADFDDDGVLNQTAGDYSDNTEFNSGDGLTFSGADRSSFTADNTGVVCFATGTMILTDKGEIPVEYLRPEDRIATYDNGFQPLAMLACRRLEARDLALHPHLRPIELKPGALGAERGLIVSPQHAMLVGQGSQEALVRANQLARRQGGAVRIMRGCRKVTYVHLIFDAHQIVFANGRPSESFYPGPRALAALTPGARKHFEWLFPEATAHHVQPSTQGRFAPARVHLKTRQLPKIVSEISQSPIRA